jgi:alanine racemase
MIDDDFGRPTWCEIDLDALQRNVEAIADHVGSAAVMPVIKADAYGHGAVRVAQRLEQAGVSTLGVAYVEEAIALRQADVSIPIHVLGGAVERQIPLFLEHGLTFTAPSVDKLQQIDAAAAARGVRARVHLKIDTGMERIGVHHYHSEALLEAGLQCSNVDIEGVFSHFANSDAVDLDSARVQLDRFEEVLEFYPERGLAMPTRHIANSGAIAQLPESWLDLVRPGILLFGVYPSAETPRNVSVEPVMAWRSEVVYFKVVEAQSPVSYGATWSPDTQTRVVTLPVGYGDGFRRSLSNSGSVLINGRRHSVVGRVCMDQTMVDIGWDSAFNGDLVTLMGSDGDECITAEDLARWADTISYEILTNITARVPRRYRPSGRASVPR